MALTIHRGNSLDSLADALAKVQSAHPLPPLTPEPVIVQSLGMKRWLSFALAGRLGVAANIAFHFPAGFVSKLFEAVLHGSEPGRDFDREVLPWRILAKLPALLEQPAFAELHRYLEGENRDLKSFQLSSQIARVFDRYLAYRPEMILEWERGKDSEWQPVLWRTISGGGLHAPALFEQFQKSISKCAEKLPARFSIFGAASLGPFFFKALSEAAHYTEAHLFLFTPTPEYWGDISPEKTNARLRRKSPAAAAHREQGHALLASFGKVGRDFFDAVADVTGALELDYFTSPAGDTALARIQRDIFELNDRTPPEAEKHSFLSDDESIQLHATHSPLREIEILHDRMLAWFERGIAPREVLVMMPDVEAYAPFIEAVFSTPESEQTRIPFSIADRAAARENIVAQAFLALLSLAGSRLTAPDVLSLLDIAPIRRRFDLDETSLVTLRDWTARAGIRWGRDAAHREEFGVPAFAQNSWQHGLDRLLLGFAMPGDGATLFENILPEPVAEGSAAVLLGSFAAFTDTLFKTLGSLATPRTAAEWAPTLHGMLQTFIAQDDEFLEDLGEVSAHLDALAKHTALAGHTAQLPLSIIRAHLNTVLAGTDRAGTGFLSGRVTFCSMKPMRSIPHRVIALLGLNGDKFPRRDSAPQFDLVARLPKAGDRSTRDDDRQIFIESILAARDVLHLSHVGLSQTDNAPLPPSPIVAELLNHLDMVFIAHGDTKPSQIATITHPLQGFSPRAFTIPRFSYSRENAHACEIASASRELRGPLFSTPLPVPEISRTITLDALSGCLVHPAKFFAKVQGIRLPAEESEASDSEPFTLAGIGKYQLTKTLTDAALAGKPSGATEQIQRASGALPPAYPGLDIFRTADAAAHQFADRIRIVAPGPPLPPLGVTALVDDWRISATFSEARTTGLLHARPSSLKAKDFLKAWLAHLVLCASAPANIEKRTAVIGLKQKNSTEEWQFTPVADPAALLRDILAFYTAAHCEPVRLFPACALEFAETKPPKSPLDKAMMKWSSDFEGARTEGDDDWNDYFFGHEEQPLDGSFEKWAVKIFAPLLANRAKLDVPTPPIRR